MQQDFLSKNKELLSSLMEASDRLPLPIALVDQELLQCWENQYLKKNYPFLCSKDNVLSLLQGYDVRSIILSLQSQDAILSCPSRVPMVNTSLTLSPIYDSQQVLVGAAVHFSVNSPEMFPTDANRSQQMLQNFSTTLRDPLSLIFSIISSMARRLEVDDVESCEVMLQEIYHSCYHMLKSCSSLSEYASYANGLSLLNLKLVPLNLYLEDLFHHLQMMVRRSGIHLTYTLPQEQVDLMLDTDKLMVVLASLVSNSIAFSQESCEEKKVHIEVSASKHSVRFVVSDNGLGIPPEVLPRVFEPFFTSGRRDLQHTHLGLGLTLCKLIVKHHQGDISILSTSEAGTSVNFTISRDLKGEQDQRLTFCDNPLDYITNTYSPIYTYLSDVCEWVNP